MVNVMMSALTEEGFVEQTKQQPGQVHVDRFV